jgi:multiple sugar transport system permease protein
MTKMKKKPVNIAKAAKTTIFYIFVVGVMVALLLPIYFIISLSFLSTREAYTYPLPLVPALKTQFKLEQGKRGYLLSVYDRAEGDYESVLDTAELEKMQVYLKSQSPSWRRRTWSISPAGETCWATTRPSSGWPALRRFPP